jgi:signal transduction histidine kinase
MYYDTKDFEKSIDYYKLYDETKEQIFNAEKSKQIAELETRYETEKKEKEAEIYRLKNVELKNALDELKRTQKQLVEAEKMASLGNLVAGVAHEINTPVGIGITAISLIIDNGKDMAKKYKNDDISEEDFENFLESIDEAGQLVMKNLKRTSQLIASFRQVSVDQMVEEKRRFNVKSYLDDILLSLSPKFKGKNIQTELSCDDGLEIVSYPGVFAQIFTNFITNSLEYGFDEDEAGNITISVGKEMPSFQKMASLKIEYRDNGKGIPDDILPNIFDPFVSSNPQKGKGLGLHIVYNLVAQKLNGSIHCESKETEGTLFKIEIPLG